MTVVSIGMPVRNCAATLPDAIRSILLQTIDEWELLLIVDGGDSETADVARGFASGDRRIRLVVGSETLGLSARLNEAIDRATGRYFARMDGDDISYPERLATQLEHITSEPSVDLIGSAVAVFNSAGKALGKRAAPVEHDAICRRPYAGFGLAHPTYFGKIEYFRRFRYRDGRETVVRLTRDGRSLQADGDLRRSEDYDMLARSFHGARFGNVAEILLGYREDSLSVVKQVRSRYCTARAAFQQARADGLPGVAAVAAAKQALKLAVDIGAIVTGTETRLLRHRYQPVTDAERAEWARVWSLVRQNEHAMTVAGGVMGGVR